MKIQFNHLLPVALMLMLGGMTIWLQYAIESPPQTEPAKNRHDPDAIGKNVTISRLDQRGIAQYHLSAERMLHYPDNDSMELFAPRFLKKDAIAELTVTANKGVLTQENKEARFYDNVELVRRPFNDRAAKSSPRCLQQPAQDPCDGGLTADKDTLRIRTQYMQVFLEQGVARTDRAVTIVNGPSTLSGTGMEYERETGRLRLLSGVKGSFHVQKN